jgi:beta-glucosidase
MHRASDDAALDQLDTARLDELLASMTIEERARLTGGVDAWHASGVESIGLGDMLTVDGPNGVREVAFPKGSTATCTPCGIALGATWDVDLVAEVASVIGAEARRAGVHYLLGPVLNLIRSPLGGRDFESYSEDPALIAELGAAYVTGMQSQRVAACPKHFVGNDSESQRTTVNCIIDERALREVYLLPFERVARAGAWSMMASYNRVNGIHGSRNGALNGTILREEWGWDGVLVSDWHAAHDTVDDIAAGLDLEMPGPAKYLGSPLAQAVRDGRVSEEALNCAAQRVLMLAARVGALSPEGAIAAGPDRIEAEDSGAASSPAANVETDDYRPWLETDPTVEAGRPIQLSSNAAASVVRRAAAESFVLLRNESILPLAPAALRRVAVIGPNSASPCIQGGGAANIAAPYAVSPLDGLRAALPAGIEIVHEPGCTIDLLLPALTRMDVVDLDGVPGLTIEFFRGQALDGEPFVRLHTNSSDLHLFGDLPPGVAQNDFSVRLSGWIKPSIAGPHRIAMRGLGGRRLFVDGKLVADEWSADAGADVPTALFEAREDGGTFELEAGKRILVAAELHSTTHAPSLLALGCAVPEGADGVALAVAAAASADVAIVVVGTDKTWDTEGRDRKSATLPGRQDELVSRVAAANPRTIVVVNAGCQMGLPWSEEVAAILYAWLPGQEFGNALADVLLGESEPGGRMPVSIARREEDYPALNTTPAANDELVYTEGVNVGYRGFDAAGLEPRFAFGEGFGYTTFEYEDLAITSDGLAEGEPLELRVRIRNTGARPGKEVIQVYVADLESTTPRPRHELKGFAVVRLGPGETGEVAMALEDRDLAYWDVERHSWRIEPGQFDIEVGHSSRDIRLRAPIDLA